jgi:heat shock protein HslJ
MRKKLTLSALHLMATLLLGSCQHDTDNPAPTAALLNTRWMLKQVDATPLALSSYSHDYDSYLQFVGAGNEVRGLATCDAIQGQFTLPTGSQQLAISQLNVTQSSCSVANIANRYLAALPQTSRFEISGNTLRLYDAQATQPRLIFEAAP